MTRARERRAADARAQDQAPVIAEQLGVSVQSVYNWSHAWRDSGVCGLMGGHNGGRPPALSDVDFHDEAPHAWVSALASPGGRRRVHLGKIWRFLRRASICKTAICSDSFQEVPKAPAITYLPATTDRAS
ncbi:helix-turn-helix domain-containing protein [Paraburkholderia hospita]|uniref:helix-turn-helix domain-containing protein n=1 Tax=Paraburkholderia hospita TaxID=169430 RepID=UPI003899278B